MVASLWASGAPLAREHIVKEAVSTKLTDFKKEARILAQPVTAQQKSTTTSHGAILTITVSTTELGVC